MKDTVMTHSDRVPLALLLPPGVLQQLWEGTKSSFTAQVPEAGYRVQPTPSLGIPRWQEEYEDPKSPQGLVKPRVT